MASKFNVHHSAHACPSSDKAGADTWAAAKDITCGIPAAVDRHARYFATAQVSSVTCGRCIRILTLTKRKEEFPANV